MTRTKRCCFLTIVFTLAIAPTGLNAQLGLDRYSCNSQGTRCTPNIGDTFGEQMQTKKPNLQNRSGTTKTAPSGTIQTQSRNVK